MTQILKLSDKNFNAAITTLHEKVEHLSGKREVLSRKIETKTKHVNKETKTNGSFRNEKYIRNLKTHSRGLITN